MLNQRYHFHRIIHKKINKSCESYSEYQKFDIKKFTLCRLQGELDGLKDLYLHAKENAALYDEYKNQYSELAKHLRTTDDVVGMRDIAITVERFQEIEKELYQKEKVKEPAVDFSVCYTVEYTSPAGRNHYEKEEYVNSKMVEVLLKELEHERIAHIEMERQRLLKQEEREIQRQERRKEQSLQRRERQLAQREEDLLRREREFKHATREHIYDATNLSHTVPASSTDNSDLSTWERMKRLKERYESGEITYEMYDEMRRNLL